MSQQYKHGDRIPTEVLAKRLDELSDAATKGEAGLHEFYMRIPAELDHDADLVLHAAAKRLRELEAAVEGALISHSELIFRSRNFLESITARKSALTSMGLDTRLSNTVNRHFRDKEFDVNSWATSVVNETEDPMAYIGIGKQGAESIIEACKAWIQQS